MRRLVYQQRRRELQTAFEGLMGKISPRVEDVELKHRDVLDFTGDMWMEISYTIPHYADPVAGGLEFMSPMALLTKDHGYLFRAGSVEWAEERKSDVFLYYTQLIDGVEEIRLPKGWSAPETPDVDEIDKTYAYFKASSDMGKRSLVIKQRVEVRRRQISPDGEGYQGYRKAINAAGEWPDTVYRVEGGAS
ncbi:hypothetical protein GF324_06825 [bacterium]|nr:hypothetical protein [bacterium]